MKQFGLLKPLKIPHSFQLLGKNLSTVSLGSFFLSMPDKCCSCSVLKRLMEHLIMGQRRGHGSELYSVLYCAHIWLPLELVGTIYVWWVLRTLWGMAVSTCTYFSICTALQEEMQLFFGASMSIGTWLCFSLSDILQGKECQVYFSLIFKYSPQSLIKTTYIWYPSTCLLGPPWVS